MEIFVFYVALLGAILGSFANVIIVRLPQSKSIVSPGSHCPKCKVQLRWYELIPILSWFICRGKCRHCGEAIGIRYLIVEVVMMILFGFTAYFVPISWTMLEYLIFIFGLVVVTFIDFEHMILPDVFTLPGILIGLLGSTLNPERDFKSALIGVLLGGGVLWLLGILYQLTRKQEGMGGGDIKLLAWIGAVLGWQSLPFVVMASSVIGSVVGIFLARKSNKGLQMEIPFGPYLALGSVLFIFMGQGLGQMLISMFFPGLTN